MGRQLPAPPPAQVLSCRLLAGTRSPCSHLSQGGLQLAARPMARLWGPAWAGRGPASQTRPEIETKADFKRGGTPTKEPRAMSSFFLEAASSRTNKYIFKGAKTSDSLQGTPSLTLGPPALPTPPWA